MSPWLDATGPVALRSARVDLYLATSVGCGSDEQTRLRTYVLDANVFSSASKNPSG